MCVNNQNIEKLLDKAASRARLCSKRLSSFLSGFTISAREPSYKIADDFCVLVALKPQTPKQAEEKVYTFTLKLLSHNHFENKYLRGFRLELSHCNSSMLFDGSIDGNGCVTFRDVPEGGYRVWNMSEPLPLGEKVRRWLYEKAADILEGLLPTPKPDTQRVVLVLSNDKAEQTEKPSTSLYALLFKIASEIVRDITEQDISSKQPNGNFIIIMDYQGRYGKHWTEQITIDATLGRITLSSENKQILIPLKGNKKEMAVAVNNFIETSKAQIAEHEAMVNIYQFTVNNSEINKYEQFKLNLSTPNIEHEGKRVKIGFKNGDSVQNIGSGCIKKGKVSIDIDLSSIGIINWRVPLELLSLTIEN